MIAHRRFTGIFGVLLLTSALAAAAPGERRYPLRQRIEAGDRCLIENVVVVTMTIGARLGDQQAPPSEGTTRTREQYIEEVLAARDNTPTRLRQRFLVARDAATDAGGNQESKTSSLQGKTFTIERKAGKIAISPAGVKIDAGDRKRLSGALAQARIPFVPGRDAAIGEAWTVPTDRLKLFFPQARGGTMTARFAAVVPRAGRECAHIRLTGELDLAVEGIPAPVKAELTGDLYHALSLQRPVAFQFAGPLALNATVDQGGRTLSLSGEGRMTASVDIQWQKTAGKPVVGTRPSATPSGEGKPAGRAETVRFEGVSFQLPAPGWKVVQTNREARRIMVGLPGEGQMRGVAVWPVEVPPAERGRSQKEHAAAYFESERREERPDGPWSGFQEGERSVDGRTYPTMSFQFHPTAAPEHVMDGFFLTYFPPDFAARHRFYILMWSDLRPRRVPAHNPQELDAVVRTLRVE